MKLTKIILLITITCVCLNASQIAFSACCDPQSSTCTGEHEDPAGNICSTGSGATNWWCNCAAESGVYPCTTSESGVCFTYRKCKTGEPAPPHSKAYSYTSGDTCGCT